MADDRYCIHPRLVVDVRKDPSAVVAHAPDLSMLGAYKSYDAVQRHSTPEVHSRPLSLPVYRTLISGNVGVG